MFRGAGTDGLQLTPPAPLQPIAWLNHDWTGGGTLYSYPPEPAEVTRMGELMHDRLYGLTQSKSPRTPYIGAWRDSARNTVQDRKLGWPTIIGLFCTFGTEAWEPPRNLIEEASLRQQRVEGALRLHWEWHDDHGYQLHDFGLEVSRGIETRRFRSFHRGADLALLDMEVDPIPIPEPGAPIAFRLSGQIPERYNYADPLGPQRVRFTVMGSAAPIPPWMIY